MCEVVPWELGPNCPSAPSRPFPAMGCGCRKTRVVNWGMGRMAGPSDGLVWVGLARRVLPGAQLGHPAP